MTFTARAINEGWQNTDEDSREFMEENIISDFRCGCYSETDTLEYVVSQYGEYVEGAIDLLCTDPGSDEALVIDYKTGDAGLTLDEIYARHEMQANFYAWVMMNQGYKSVTCTFVCVEQDRGDGQPVSVSYTYDPLTPPKMT